MKQIVILSDGVWRRPQDTPAGKAGWIAEITFFSDPFLPYIKPHENIIERFETKEEADSFLKKELYKLYTTNPERVKHYVNESRTKDDIETHREPSLW